MSLRRISRADSEKDLAVLTPEALSLLGLMPADRVRIMSAVLSMDGTHVRVKSKSLRSSTGAASRITPEDTGVSESYPAPGNIYLDAHARRELGVEKESRYPILVQADVRAGLMSRMFVYGLSFLLGVSAILELVNLIAGDLSPGISAAVGVGMSVALTVTVAYADTRSRLSH
jgi:hypothetical protein